MTNFLVKTFIKNSQDINNPRVRGKYGTLSSVTGIVCNLILFSLKYIMGTLSGSIAVISDAFNNLSDCASCIVTLLGYKMASKPADKDHPFGHGRMEYLVSLVIAAVIFFMGLELLKSSLKKLFQPEKVDFSLIVLMSLALSAGLKLWMAHFNTVLGNKLKSSVMLATAKDSRSDVIATSAAMLSVICSAVTDAPVDGIAGAAVSVFILKSGYDIIKDTVDELLGKPAPAEIIEKIRELVCSDERIIGIHDLIIHSYGPGHMIGSCHAEIRSDENILAAHDLIDRIEREIHKQLRIMMTIHMDPIEVDNEQIQACRELLSGALKQMDEGLSFHDLRVVTGDTHINLIFDLVVPFECDKTDDELKEQIDDLLSGTDKDYYTVITFDRSYT